jgi:L-Ala-D/L-Glu epimerase
MVESSIGISPAIYLSSMADYFDFDGPLLLQNDIATGIQFNIEQIAVDDNIIGGPKMKEEFLNA